jgi:3-oxoacyl-[acyl-carrier protein] reductase
VSINLKKIVTLNITLTDSLITEFIKITGDRNSLHTDHDFARRTPYRNKVAHGMLPVSIAIAAGSLDYIKSSDVYIKQIKGSFLKPIYAGDDIQIETALIRTQSPPQEQTVQYTIRNAKAKIVLASGTWVLGHFKNEPSIAGRGAGATELLNKRIQQNQYTLDQIGKGSRQKLEFSISKKTLQAFKKLFALSTGLKLPSLRPSWASNILATILLSTMVGMKSPGKSATFIEFDMAYDGVLDLNKDYSMHSKVDFKSETSRLIISSINITTLGKSAKTLAKGHVHATLMAPAISMPSMREIKRDKSLFGFKKKVVLVTGASRGLGETIAKYFASYGALVVVNYHRGTKDANRVVSEIRDSGGEALAVQADVSDADSVGAMLKVVQAKYGLVDILVNNAVKDASPSAFLESSWAEFELDMATTLKGTFNTCQAVLPHMLKKGAGKIINISTIFVDNPLTNQSKYITSKSAVVGLTRSLAVEFAEQNIQINLVVPSIMETDLSQGVSKIWLNEMKKQTPMARHASPMDAAKAVIALASNLTPFTTGQKIMVTGGNAPFL